MIVLSFIFVGLIVSAFLILELCALVINRRNRRVF